jgi:hypothetical protein
MKLASAKPSIAAGVVPCLLRKLYWKYTTLGTVQRKLPFSTPG